MLGAFVVTAGTLLLQGLSLPWLARRLRIEGPDAREDALAEATVLMSAVEAGRAELDRIRTPKDDQEMLQLLRDRGESRLNKVWERLGRTGGDDDETPSEQYRRLRMAMLGAEREEVIRIRDHGTTDSDVLAELMEALDVEESMIDRRAARAEAKDGKTLITPAKTAGACDDLDAPIDGGDAEQPGGLHRLPAGGHQVGAPAAVRDLRQRRLLRLLGAQARDPAFQVDAASGDAQLRAGRGVAVVLRARGARLSRSRSVGQFQARVSSRRTASCGSSTAGRIDRPVTIAASRLSSVTSSRSRSSTVAAASSCCLSVMSRIIDAATR